MRQSRRHQRDSTHGHGWCGALSLHDGRCAWVGQEVSWNLGQSIEEAVPIPKTKRPQTLFKLPPSHSLLVTAGPTAAGMGERCMCLRDARDSVRLRPAVWLPL